jgi:hypothetical protein
MLAAPPAISREIATHRDARRKGLLTGPRRQAGGRWPLAITAVASVLAAVAMDVLASERPSHTAAVAIVAVVVAVLRLTVASRCIGMFSAVCAALVVQPALHAISKLGRPVVAMQVGVPALMVIAVAVCASLVLLLFGALRRPRRLLISTPAESSHRVPIATRTVRHGSMLRWCGWLAARAGPPPGGDAGSAHPGLVVGPAALVGVLSVPVTSAVHPRIMNSIISGHTRTRPSAAIVETDRPNHKAPTTATANKP